MVILQLNESLTIRDCWTIFEWCQNCKENILSVSRIINICLPTPYLLKRVRCKCILIFFQSQASWLRYCAGIAWLSLSLNVSANGFECCELQNRTRKAMKTIVFFFNSILHLYVIILVIWRSPNTLKLDNFLFLSRLWIKVKFYFPRNVLCCLIKDLKFKRIQ